MIPRALTAPIESHLGKGKAVILFGPRQCGKTTLLRDIATRARGPVLWLNGDEPDVRQQLPQATSTRLRALIGEHRTVIIDEAQRIENIGLCLKLIVDNIPGVQVIASGSSSFELGNRINEPLTGRKFEYFLFPLSFGEMVTHSGLLEERRLLNHRLIFGSYPEVITSPGREQPLLQALADSYLYKDILTWERIQKPDLIEKLVQALAYQVGTEVSYHELAQEVGLNNETIERYIFLLERSFIVFRVGSFSRNLRNELKRSRKIYFYDTGIRNAVIKNFAPVELRNDVGALWENYLVAERMKLLSYRGIAANRYFWRTHAQQEIDYLEERNGHLSAFDFKWNRRAKIKISTTFAYTYPDASTTMVTPDTYDTFLLEYEQSSP